MYFTGEVMAAGGVEYAPLLSAEHGGAQLGAVDRLDATPGGGDHVHTGLVGVAIAQSLQRGTAGCIPADVVGYCLPSFTRRPVRL